MSCIRSQLSNKFLRKRTSHYYLTWEKDNYCGDYLSPDQTNGTWIKLTSNLTFDDRRLVGE